MGRNAKSDPHATRWGKFLQAAIKFEASDLIMKSDQVPKLRLRAALKPLDTEPVTTDEFWGIAQAHPLRGAGRRTSTSSARSTSRTTTTTTTASA